MSSKERPENGFEGRKGDFECRMLIPSKMAGSIIGKISTGFFFDRNVISKLANF